MHSHFLIVIPAGQGFPGGGPYRIGGAVPGSPGGPGGPGDPCCPAGPGAPLLPASPGVPAAPSAPPESGNGTPKTTKETVF